MQNITDENNSDDDIIPCEICNEMISFNNYIQHVETCYISRQLPSFRNFNNNSSTRRNNSEFSIEDIGRIVNEDFGSFLSFIASTIDSSNNSTEPLLNLASNASNVFSNYNTFNSNQTSTTNPPPMSIPLNNPNFDFNNLVMLIPAFFNNDNNYEFNLELQHIMGGDVDVGVSNVDECYRIISNDNDFNSNISSEDNKCGICLETYTEKNDDCQLSCHLTDFVKTKCKHIYCKTCIDKWLITSYKCPICMFEFK